MLGCSSWIATRLLIKGSRTRSCTSSGLANLSSFWVVSGVLVDDFDGEGGLVADENGFFDLCEGASGWGGRY